MSAARHRPWQDTRLTRIASARQDGRKDQLAKLAAAAASGADRLVTNHAVARTVTHEPVTGVRNSPSPVKGIVVKGRRLHWLYGCTGSRDRLAPDASAESTASTCTAWHSSGSVAATGRPAAAGSPTGQRRPAGQRRPTGGPEAAGSARQSRTAVRHLRTRRDRGTDRSGCSDHCDRCGRRYRRYCRGRWTALTTVPP